MALHPISPANLPIQGSPSYLPHLLSQFSSPQNGGFDFDKQLFIGLLLCLITQGKNLIVDVEIEEEDDEEEDEDSGDGLKNGRDRKEIKRDREKRGKEAEKRVMRMVELIATNIFGLQTQLIRLSSRWTHLDLPSRLAFPPSSKLQQSSSSQTPRHSRPNTPRDRKRSGSSIGVGFGRTASSMNRTLSEKPVAGIEAYALTKPSTSTLRTKSAPNSRFPSNSITNSSPLAIPLTASPEEALSPLPASSGSDAIPSPSLLESGRMNEGCPPASIPLDPLKSTRNETEVSSPRLGHAHAVPTTSQSDKRAPSPSSFQSQIPTKTKGKRKETLLHRIKAELPKILIVNNLESASYDAQLSLFLILHDRKVTIPSGRLQKALEEEEAVQDVERSKEEREIEDGERIRWGERKEVGDGVNEVFGVGMDKDEEIELSGRFCCVWVRRRSYKTRKVPPFLLDQFGFSCSANLGSEDASGVYEEPLPELKLQELVTREHLLTSNRLANKTHLHPPLRLQISDLVSSTLHHPHLRSNLTSQATLDIKDFIRVSRILFRPFEWKADLLDPEVQGRQYDQRRKLQEAMEREDWFATDEDVRMIWGNLVSHRVELRSEKEEVWAILLKGMCADGDRWSKDKVPYEESRRVVNETLRYILDVV